MLQKKHWKKIDQKGITSPITPNNTQKWPPSEESGRFYPIFTDNHSFRFRKKTLLPPAVVEKIKVFGSVLFE